MHLLFKVKFWARREIIFCSKNTTTSHAIFCLGRWAMVQRIFRNYFRIFGVIEMGVALEH